MSVSSEDTTVMDDEDLINAVRLRSVLYKVDEDDYRNVNKKSEAWNEVAREMGKSGETSNHLKYSN